MSSIGARIKEYRLLRGMTQQEIADALALICRQNNLTMEQLKDYYDAEFEAAVMKSVLTSKVMGLIREAADITVVE